MFALGIVLLIAGALVVAAEVHSFTVYLLAVAAACFAAGALALSGHAALDVTLIVFAAVLLAGLPAAHFARRRLKNAESERVSSDDVGAAVEVVAVAKGALRVSYRGAEWDARPVPGLALSSLVPGMRLTVAARDGNTLVVAPPRGALASGV